MMYRGSGNLWAGVALIAIGLAFLARNYFAIPFFENWWALFILIPAVGSLYGAWQAWRRGSPYAASGSLTVGLVLGAVAGIFLLDLAWRDAWPVLLILAGVGMLLPGLLTRRAPPG